MELLIAGLIVLAIWLPFHLYTVWRRRRPPRCAKCQCLITRETGCHFVKVGCLEDLEWYNLCDKCYGGQPEYKFF